ncbi:signal transduction histidine kinase [Desulfosporosinus acidiphilus SJ4]|uniref:histidine kinase n=1 Tax=Desulfosporosinus acidiphilus (strain DSM 22704 / JCM 16185 / SJ4) TaxID=646529 RepID=I4D1F1_DESAJ|nr:ATP-binding protein [Desulfosporosinus acidiphilus]AFM39625.1 signal transduction histidine kinase [Desulfosporosinus acidiphilus SJ4]
MPSYKLDLKNRHRVYFDLLIISIVIVILTVIHYTTYHYTMNYHIMLQFAYYLPVIYAAMRFGLAGGILSGLLITVLILPFMTFFQTMTMTSSAMLTQWVEIGLTNGIGWLTGFLIEQERKATRKHQLALQIQKELVEKLKHESLERERLQSEIRQTERLIALGHLSAGLAHEIRNPLGIMKVSIQLLAQDKREDREVLEYCRVLQEECERLNRLVSEFLSFARPKELVRGRVKLGKLLAEGVSLIQPALRQHQIELSQTGGQVDDYEVEADSDQIKQVILNILLNAIDAQGEGGRILLEGIQPKDFVGFAVSDEGQGISPDVLPYIYDPFFTTKEKGTGLGLSVVHRILDQHGGKISVSNRNGRGTRVEILLPRCEEGP